MAKKKKTRKQKIVADTRHEKILSKFPTIAAETMPAHNPTEKPVIIKPQISTIQYSYLYSDLTKTLLLTISIVIIELLLKYFLFGVH